MLRDFIGGAGLGTWLLTGSRLPGVDPLAPAAPLVFVFSPLVGTPLTTSAKFAVVAQVTADRAAHRRPGVQPLRDRRQAHRARRDRRHRARPTATRAARRRRRRPPRAGRRRMGTAGRATPRPRCASGSARRGGSPSIGPAGERWSATPPSRHDGRHAGRGGLGAVLGAKHIKAVAVRPATKVAPADPAGVLAAARDLRVRSFGPATAKYRELGTAGQPARLQRASARCRPATSRPATFEEAPALSAEELAEPAASHRDQLRRPAPSAASTSTAARAAAGARRVRERVRPRPDVRRVAMPTTSWRPAQRCDELGLDTISAGGTIAWAMECAERGLIDAPWLRFGDGAAVLRALDEIGTARGLGDLLAEGSRRAAEQVGGGSADFAPHVKGLEMPGYEPRDAARDGARPRRQRPRRRPQPLGRLRGRPSRRASTGWHGGPEHVAAAIETEDQAAIMDSLILCKFLRGVFDGPFADWADCSRGHRLGRRRRRAARDGAPGSCSPSGPTTARGLDAG